MLHQAHLPTLKAYGNEAVLAGVDGGGLGFERGDGKGRHRGAGAKLAPAWTPFCLHAESLDILFVDIAFAQASGAVRIGVGRNIIPGSMPKDGPGLASRKPTSTSSWRAEKHGA